MLPITVNWERSPSAPTPVFGYDTKQNYAPQPTDNVFDSGNFNTINPNVFMGKRANDGKLNFKQYGMYEQWHNKGKMFSQDNNSAWESNVSWAGKTGMSKNENYQGESVNFAQTSMTEYNARNIARIDKSLYTYPQQYQLSSAKSDSDIWKWIGQNITGKSSAQSGGNEHYSWGINPNAYMPKLDRLEKMTQDDHAKFGNTLTELGKTDIELGNKLIEAKNERDRIEAKINQNNGGGFNPFGGLIPSLSLSTIAIGGLAAYLLLRKK
jgi:hypothetical protein